MTVPSSHEGSLEAQSLSSANDLAIGAALERSFAKAEVIASRPFNDFAKRSAVTATAHAAIESPPSRVL